jgi:hypothetical protein
LKFNRTMNYIQLEIKIIKIILNLWKINYNYWQTGQPAGHCAVLYYYLHITKII